MQYTLTVTALPGTLKHPLISILALSHSMCIKLVEIKIVSKTAQATKQKPIIANVLGELEAIQLVFKLYLIFREFEGNNIITQ